MTSTAPNFLTDGSSESPMTCVLAHGAGAAMDTPFMNAVAGDIAKRGVYVARFEFPYMAQRRTTGKKRGPDRPAVLIETWNTVIDALRPRPLVIGGKSMGGRVASMIADDADVAGVVCLGYPFHPVGKPDQLRIEHLQNIQTPTLIIQGQRDPFGKEEEVPRYGLGTNVQVHWLPDGDHSFKPRKSSGVTEDKNWAEAAEVAAEFIHNI